RRERSHPAKLSGVTGRILTSSIGLSLLASSAPRTPEGQRSTPPAACRWCRDDRGEPFQSRCRSRRRSNLRQGRRQMEKTAPGRVAWYALGARTYRPPYLRPSKPKGAPDERVCQRSRPHIRLGQANHHCSQGRERARPPEI